MVAELPSWKALIGSVGPICSTIGLSISDVRVTNITVSIRFLWSESARLSWQKCVRMLQPSEKRRMILIHPLVSCQTRIGRDSWIHQLLSPCPTVQPSLCLCLFYTNAVITFVCCMKYPPFVAVNALCSLHEIPFVCCMLPLDFL